MRPKRENRCTVEANLPLLQSSKITGKWAEKKCSCCHFLSQSRTNYVTLKLGGLNWQDCSLISIIKAFLSRPCFSDYPQQSNHLEKQKPPKSPYFNHSWCPTWMPGIFIRTEFVLQPSVSFLGIAGTFTMANDWHLPWQMSGRRISKVIKIMSVHVTHGGWLGSGKYILWCYPTKISRPSFKDSLKLIEGLFNVSVH